MKKRRLFRPGQLDPGINLSPMLDVLFNLIFFFLLTSTMRLETLQMQVTLPEVQTAQPGETGNLPVILVDAGGEVLFGQRVIGSDAELQLEMQALARRGDKHVLIRGDERANYGRVMKVMDICRQAGLEKAELDFRGPGANNNADVRN